MWVVNPATLVFQHWGVFFKAPDSSVVFVTATARVTPAIICAFQNAVFNSRAGYIGKVNRSCGRCKERFPVGNYSCSVPELIANHLGSLQSPIRVTNCSPLTIVVDLNDTPTNVILVFWRDKAHVIFFQKEKGKQRKKQREGKEIITNLQCLLCRCSTSFMLATNVLWAYRKAANENTAQTFQKWWEWH